MVIKNILVPVDFSKFSNTMLATAIKIAESYKAKVHLLHIEEDLYRIQQGHELSVMDKASIPIIEGFHQTLLRECGKKLNEYLHRIPQAVRGSADMREGHPTEMILNYINENSIDLVVLGSHGESDLAAVLLGSTTDKLARKAPCSVFIVKDKSRGA